MDSDVDPIVSLANEMKAQTELLKKIHWEVNRSRNIQENIRVSETSETLNAVRSFLSRQQLSLTETLGRVRDEDLSFARFGDGEFRLMTRIEFDLKFQKNSYALQDALRGVLSSDTSGLLLGLPHGYVDLHWSTVYTEVWGLIRPLLGDGRMFGNSHVSRPLMFQTVGREGAKMWSQVWEGREAALVTGRGSRFDMREDLFDSLKSHTVIESLPQHAFAVLDEVLEQALSTDAELFLISLGPTGTLLASELAKCGRQALDIGHLSSSYDHVIAGGAFPEQLATSK